MSDIQNVEQLFVLRNEALDKEKQIYISAIKNINARTDELFNEQFGNKLVKNSARDLAGEVARRYFDLSDMYITVDQLFDRFVNFSYDMDSDILMDDANIRKTVYNFNDHMTSSTFKNIRETCDGAQEKLFDIKRSEDNADGNARSSIRMRYIQNGKIEDEFSGQKYRKKNYHVVEADHIQSREAASYNARYLKTDAVEKLQKFYNSSDNMQMLNRSANRAKGDVRVVEIDGKVEYVSGSEYKSRVSKGENIKDISHRATPEQLADATISRMEKETKSDKINTLKKKGYLDEDGKVKPEMRKKLIDNAKKSQNAESKIILKEADYGSISKDAGKESAKSLGKIFAGQVIYYILPPILLETRTIVNKKGMTMDGFFVEIKKAGKRVIKYAKSKLGEMFKNVAGNGFSKFLKTFFDIIIEMVKATIKRFVQIVKNLIMTLVNCGKVLLDKKSTAAQKADAISKMLATTITTVVMELLFEYLEKQFGLPGFLMEPLQLVVTILATNIVMLLLEEMDLFDTRYGFLVSNIKKIFDEEKEFYVNERDNLLQEADDKSGQVLEILQNQVKESNDFIKEASLYDDEVTPYLDTISKTFKMDIDFQKEWGEYVTAS
ncbi:hypothetical protein M2149_000922 [Lachnospiraceae bacterium PFB1-21]